MNTKKPSGKGDNEEYHYPEEQFGEEIQTPEEAAPDETSDKKSGFAARFSRKKLFIIIAIVILVAAIYHFLSRREEAVLESGKRELAATEVPLSTPPLKTATTVRTVAPQQAISLEQTQQLAKVSGLESKVQDLQMAAKQANQSINELNTALLSLANSVEVLSNQVRELGSIERVQVVAPVMAGPARHYHLKSLIAGRAWLETGKGKLITVKVGDALPGYGDVTRISPSEGLVETSSGITITYGPNDS